MAGETPGEGWKMDQGLGGLFRASWDFFVLEWRIARTACRTAAIFFTAVERKHRELLLTRFFPGSRY